MGPFSKYGVVQVQLLPNYKYRASQVGGWAMWLDN